MLLLPCAYGTVSAACRVEARWGELYSTEREVTTDAIWSSSAPGIVQVTAPGTLRAGSPGDAAITATYRGVALTETFRVYAGEPPWWTCLRCENIWSAMDVDGRPLADVAVEITGGHEIGSRAVSDQFGRVIFHGLPCGPVTARATKEGYTPWTGSATLCGTGGNGRPGSEGFPTIRLQRLADTSATDVLTGGR